jgi:hypothetical protein
MKEQNKGNNDNINKSFYSRQFSGTQKQLAFPVYDIVGYKRLLSRQEVLYKFRKELAQFKSKRFRKESRK